MQIKSCFVALHLQFESKIINYNFLKQIKLKKLAETQYAIIDNTKIAYRKFGNGSPIILANRFRGTLDTWDPLFLQLLAEKNTIIQFDYPGIGYSEGELPIDAKEVASYVDKIADYLNINHYTVLGWSYGGFIAQYATFLQPKKVKDTIIIGSNPLGKNIEPIKQSFLDKAFIPNYTLEDEIELFYEPTSEKSREAAKLSHNRIEEFLDRTKIPTDPVIFQRYFSIAEQIAKDEDLYVEEYKKTDTRFLLISADNDTSNPVENWFKLLQNAPTLQHIIFNGTGHAPHFQYPKQSVRYIQAFLEND